MEDYPGIIKDWEKAIEKDSMSCPNCEALARKLAEAENIVKTLYHLMVAKIDNIDDQFDALLTKTQAFLTTFSVPGWVVVKREDLKNVTAWFDEMEQWLNSQSRSSADEIYESNEALKAALKEKP